MIVGILAVQGGYSNHKSSLDKMNITNIYIRYPEDLDKCNALIIPGGESSSISKHIDTMHLREEILKFSLNYPIMGTCAGMIMLSSNKSTKHVSPLNIMNFKVERNFWGRQINSFAADIHLQFDKDIFHAIFIRAPKITWIDNEIKILSLYNKIPILITNGLHLASSFHPELGDDLRIHKYFLKHIYGKVSNFI